MASSAVQRIRQAWGVVNPYVRQYAPEAFEFGRRVIGSDLFGPAVGALYSIYQGDKLTKDYLPDLFTTPDAKYVPTGALSLQGTKRTYEQAFQQAIPGSNAESGDAVNSPFDVSNQAGPSVDVNMVRRMGYRRRLRRRAPGTAYRRIFRSWTGLARLRRRGRSLYRPELKSIDGLNTAVPIVFVGSTVDATAAAATFGNAVLLNGCIQGADIGQRIGNQILVKSLLVRGCVCVPTGSESSVTFTECCRIMVVQDRQANGAMPTVLDLFETQEILSGTVSTWPMNLVNRSRFKVLYDKRFVLTGATNGAEFFFEYFNNKKRIKTIYDGTAATPPYNIALIRTNAVWMFCFANFAAAGSTVANRPYLNSFSFRTRFIDP